MKRIIISFFVVLGVLFFILIILGVYFFIVDPYHIKPIIFGTQIDSGGENSPTASSTQSTTQEDKNPLLNEVQEKALEGVGINPKTLPTQITPEQESCFIQTIGIDRVTQIKAGDLPTATEFLRARDCL